MKYFFAFVMMIAGSKSFAQAWSAVSTTGWEFNDNATPAKTYFSVSYPNAITTINNPNTTYPAITLLKFLGPSYPNNHVLEITYFGNDNIVPDINWSYGGGPGSASIINFQPKPLTFGTSNKGRMIILANGNVGIGTYYPQFLLAVKGTIGAQEVNVTTTGWSDYVFENDYKLPSLKEVERYIQSNHHLAEIPSAEEVKRDGVDLGKMNEILVKKIEELTLYIIEQEKRISKIENSIKN